MVFWIPTKETNFWPVWDFWADALALFPKKKRALLKLIFIEFSAISKLAEKYSFGKLYLEVHHLLSYYVSMYHLGSYQKYHTKLLALFFKMCFFYVSFIPFFVFGFWSLLATKLQKCYVIFVYILQGKMGKTEKTERKSCN